jgi:hypothetical protein
MLFWRVLFDWGQHVQILSYGKLQQRDWERTVCRV